MQDQTPRFRSGRRRLRNANLLSLMLLATLAGPAAPPAGAQNTAWVARYNGTANGPDSAYGVAVDAVGYVYVTGGTGEGNSRDFATVKYDPNGNEIWVRRYNGPGNSSDEAYAVAVDGAGNVFVTGESVSGTLEDFATLKYDANGLLLWARRYNGPGNDYDSPVALAVDAAGSVYVTGSSGSAAGHPDYATLKYDATGNQSWVRRYDGPAGGFDFASALAVDPAGNVVVTGSSEGDTTAEDYATVRYDAAGNQTWARRYNGPASGLDAAHAVAVDAAGSVFVTGESAENEFKADMTTLKYNAAGTLQWAQRYNRTTQSTATGAGVAVDPMGSVYVAGTTTGPGTGDDITTLKYASGNGALLWARFFNGPGNDNDTASALAVDAGGSVAVAGTLFSFTSGFDYGSVRYAGDGTPLHTANVYNGPANAEEFAAAVAVDAGGSLYVAGDSLGAGTSTDYATVKYAYFSYSPSDVAVSPADNTTRFAWKQHEGASSWTVFPNGGVVSSNLFGPFSGWSVRAVGAGYDGRSRILWTHFDGRAAIWRVSAQNALEGSDVFGPYPGWTAVDVAVDPESKARVLWRHADGQAATWTVGAGGVLESSGVFGPYAGWTARALSVGGDNRGRVLWTSETGQVSLWTVSAAQALEGATLYGPYPGWSAADLVTGPDNRTRLLWRHIDGYTGVWRVSLTGAIESAQSYGPYAGWSARALALDNDGKVRLLWSHLNGQAALWSLRPDLSLEASYLYGPF